MKLKEFLNNLNELVEKDSKILEYEVVYSTDDEGNSFHNVIFTPEIGYYENNEFIPSTCDEFINYKKSNAICIN